MNQTREIDDAAGRAAVARLGSVLGIWAHPDDEAYLSGGVMALARDNGQRVVCVTATRGELGTPYPVAWPPDRLANERTWELACCLEILGVTEHHWLGYADGQCAVVPEREAVGRLRTVIERVRTDTVITFGPDGLSGHDDHRAVSAWAAAAFDRAAPPGARLLYATLAQQVGLTCAGSSGGRAAGARSPRAWASTPGLPVLTPDAKLPLDLELDEETARRKFRALAAQATQTAGLIAHLGADRYMAWVADEPFIEAAVRLPAAA